MSAISSLATLGAVSSTDLLPIVDVSDPSMAASGTTKKVTYSALLGGNVIIAPSGDPTGAADTAAINAALGATTGACVQLGPGQYYINSDIQLQAAGQQLAGQQIKGTIIQAVGSSFTNGIVAITADRCGVHDVLFQNASTTITSNPAATAIWISGTFHTFIENVEGIYVNGWLVDLESTGSATNLYMRHVVARQCAGGIKLSGPVSNRAIGCTMDGCSTAQIGVSSGPFANLDALYAFRVTDITMTNCNFSVGNATTGHGAHFVAVSNVYLSVFDMGGFPIPLPGSGQCGILVNGNATDGNTSGVHFKNGVLQTWDIGALITGNCTNVDFEDVNVGGNMTHGIKNDSNFGNSVFVRNCKLGVSSGSNGNGGATSYSYTATSASPAVFTATGSGFANGAAVQLASGAPTGFSTGTTYYVVSVAGASFSLAATVGGTAINSASTGAGALNTGPSYDLYWNSTAACRITNCEFNSAIVAVGSSGVQQSIAVPSGNQTQFVYNRFTGTGTSTANQYTNVPVNVASSFASGAVIPAVISGSLYGHKVQACDLALTTGNAGQLLVNGTIYLSQIIFDGPLTISTLYWFVKTVGVTATAGQNWAGLVGPTGTVLASVGTDTQAVGTGRQSASITAQSIDPANGKYWIAFLFNCATAPTLLLTAAANNGGIVNVSLTAANYRYATNGTAATALPASFTLSSNVSQGSPLWWAAA